MRKPTDLDRMLENAVASALGVDLPHPEVPHRVSPRTRPASRRRQAANRRQAAMSRRERFAA